ncbi:tetratricopeptide repeat protein 23-like [Physella acuta]|uniref:tetratricopeptide repeat protein 23-like n=1 Tax=Physella acuta TaxID=109671 RepID=UPI0027DEA7CF|nr:tetratricopeptide repeat protein 23-like [Physella acuta]
MEYDLTDEEIAPIIPVVEISNLSQHRQAWEARSDTDDHHDVEYDETASSTKKHVNGKVKHDLTPADIKLKQSESLAVEYALKHKVDKAIEERIKCLAYTRIVYGSSHWKHAQSIINLAEDYINLKQYFAQAEYHAETAKSIMLHGNHLASSLEEKANLFTVLIQIYRILGQAATALKKYNEAEQALQKADRISKELSKLECVTDKECDHLDILLYQAMARLYTKQKKHALASEKYDKVIELMTKEFGNDSIQVMQANTEYGMLEQSKGKFANHDKTIQLFLEAHSIATAIYKEGHPDLIDTALNLSLAYAGNGWEEAEGSALSYLEECLRSCTALYGPNHGKTLEVQDHLAKMYIRMGKMNDAMQILMSSLPSKMECFGDYSESVSESYKLMGSINLSEGNIEKALRAYKKCYTIEVVLHGKDHRKTKSTLQTMEMLLSNPSLSQKFLLNKGDDLLKRPRFNSVVGRTK